MCVCVCTYLIKVEECCDEALNVVKLVLPQMVSDGGKQPRVKGCANLLVAGWRLHVDQAASTWMQAWVGAGLSIHVITVQ